MTCLYQSVALYSHAERLVDTLLHAVVSHFAMLSQRLGQNHSHRGLAVLRGAVDEPRSAGDLCLSDGFIQFRTEAHSFRICHACQLTRAV